MKIPESVKPRSGDFRFRPPAVDLMPALAVVLDLAFGPVVDDFSLPGSVSGPEIFDAARSVYLADRIAARWPDDRLAELCGTQVAADFKAEFWETAAVEFRAETVIEKIAAAAVECKMPVLFLKGAALMLGHEALQGSRDFNDVDVLAPGDRAQELWDCLKAGGFQDCGLPTHEHHLGMLDFSAGPAVEVHFCIRGVRSSAGTSLTLDEAVEINLVRSLPHFQGQCWIPHRDLLLAHALVHGIAQHGLSPQGYPMLKVLADAVDMALPQSVEDGTYRTWFPLIERDVSLREVCALAELGRRLGQGQSAAAVWQEEGDEALFLRHCVLGNLDEKYTDSLRLRAMASVLPSRNRWGTVVHMVWHTLFPSRAVIDAYYDTPGGRWRYVVFRIRRPFVLMGRAVRYSWAAWVMRRQTRPASKIDN